MTAQHLVKYRLLIFIVIGILHGCSSAPKVAPKQQLENQSSVAEINDKSKQRSTQFYLSRANAPGADTTQQRAMHIKALTYAIAEQKTEDFLLALLERIEVDEYNTVALDIELAKGLLFAAQYDPALNDDANIVMTRLNQGNVAKKHQMSLWLLKAQLESNQNLHMQVIRTIFRLEGLHKNQLSDNDKMLLSSLLWRHILHVSNDTLQSFQNDFNQSSTAWIALARVISQHLTDANELPKQLAIWQRTFPQYVNSKYLPAHIKSLLTIKPYNPQHIAILLPLSGKLKRQSESIRNGFIAAMSLDNEVTISIFDTDKYTLAEIEAKVLSTNVDFIVGPLVKEKVESIMEIKTLANIPSLYLNAPELTPLSLVRDNSYFFALAPEDEIAQAVEYFVANDYKNPTLIYADNSLGRRLAQHFNKLWTAATEREVESIAFKSKSKLGEAVEDLLDVNLSKKRIAQMKELFGNALETASRSRTDIDAVYIVANSQQTRLIKPFFDVNVSVFGEKLPIFASSRSYLVDESKSQKRDLNELTFTEMPWLIRNKARSLHSLYSKVGEQQTQLKKLFAFGYDAKNLIYALKQIETISDQSFEGLTGNLTITENNRIKRDLEWSRYQQGRIIAVAQMEQ